MQITQEGLKRLQFLKNTYANFRKFKFIKQYNLLQKYAYIQNFFTLKKYSKNPGQNCSTPSQKGVVDVTMRGHFLLAHP
jgi:hypothetical protein